MRRALACVACLLALHSSPALADDKPAPAPGKAQAKLEAFVISSSPVKPADSDAPMAEGWPKGTDPGMIEVKHYPSYRSAVARGSGASIGADNMLFFPLFRHITNSDIAMTTPVVSNYTSEMVQTPKATGDVSMEFVYRSPTMGQSGKGLGNVKVEDHPATTYVCLGVQGDLDADRMKLGVEALRVWLKDHKDEWSEDGPPRRLGYHGPMTKRNERLWEVQLPVKAVPKPAPPAKP